MTTDNKQPERFTTDDLVWFEINGEVYNGQIMHDDGGLTVSVDVTNAGECRILRHLLAVSKN